MNTGSCAAERYEPRQIRKEAAVNSKFWVPQEHLVGAGVRDKPVGESRQWVHGLKFERLFKKVGNAEGSFTIEVQEKSPAGGLGVSPSISFSPKIWGARGLKKINIQPQFDVPIVRKRNGAKCSPVIVLHKRKIQILGGQAKWN